MGLPVGFLEIRERAMYGQPWYGIRVRSNFESTTAMVLEGKGFHPFLPLRQVRRRRCDRYKTISIPLFPGYVFCRLDVQRRLPVLTSPGVVSIIGRGKTPEPIPNGEIDAIQTVLNSGLAAEPWPLVRQGQRVRLQEGPLAGLEGHGNPDQEFLPVDRLREPAAARGFGGSRARLGPQRRLTAETRSHSLKKYSGLPAMLVRH